MFSKMPAYGETKDSAFWQAAVPAHWEVEPGLSVCAENKRKNANLTEDQVLSLSFGRIVVKPIEKQRGLVPDSYEGYQVLDPGDIVVRPTDLQNDQTSIRVGLVRDRGIITSAYIGLRPKTPWTTGYAHAYLATVDSTKRIYGMGSGLRQQLGWTRIKRMPCLVPPADEQAAIVKYLAHANARIDKGIAAKRCLISLLDQEEQALGVAVIAGAAPPTRQDRLPSDWFGELPLGWRRGSLRWLARIFSGSTPSRADSRYWSPGEVPWIASGKVNDLRVRTPSELISRQAVYDCSLQLAAAGSVIVGLVGQGKTRGASALLEIDTYINQNLAAVVPGRELDSEFLWLVLRAGYPELRSRGRGGNQAALNADLLGSFPIPVPDLEEQRAIVERFSDSASKLQQARRHADAEVALLHEFRTRLVADVVTGQVDVRELTASLPEVDLTASWGDSGIADDVDPADFDDTFDVSEG